MSCWVLPHPTSLLPLLRCVLAHMVVSHPHCLLCPPYPDCFSGLCPDLTTLPAFVNGLTEDLLAYRIPQVIKSRRGTVIGSHCVSATALLFFSHMFPASDTCPAADVRLISSGNGQGNPSSCHSADCRRSDPASHSHRSPHHSCRPPGWRPALQMPSHA